MTDFKNYPPRVVSSEAITDDWVAAREERPSGFIVDDVPTATEAEVQQWFEESFRGEVTPVEGQPGVFLDGRTFDGAYDPQPALSEVVLRGLGVPAEVIGDVQDALNQGYEHAMKLQREVEGKWVGSPQEQLSAKWAGSVQAGEYWINPETGEILGLAADYSTKSGDEKALFRIQTQDDLEWVMSLFFEAEADVDAAKRRTEALLENARALTAEKQRRVDYLKFRFTGDLEHWTHEKLDGLKERSVKTPFGTLGFRKTQGTIEVLNREAAIKFLVDFEAHLELPGDVVRTAQTVSVSALKGHESKLPPDLFEVTPAQDRFYMKSGVGK